ncbi:MAG: hypothetical protein ACRDKW_17840, partial [Actinomycetota bacterium]
MDPALAAARVDFGIDPETGIWTGEPLEHVSAMLTELGQARALEVLGEMTLQEALAQGIPRVCAGDEAALAADPAISGIGMAVVAVRVVGIGAEPEVERALQRQPGNGCSRTPTGRRSSGGLWRWSGNGRSSRTSSPPGSSWPAGKRSSSGSAARTSTAAPRTTP